MRCEEAVKDWAEKALAGTPQQTYEAKVPLTRIHLSSLEVETSSQSS